MDMISVVSVAMLVLLSMAVPQTAVMVRMHAVLGPHGLQDWAHDHSSIAKSRHLR